MKKRLRTLFYGLTHEHAHGKLQTLARMADDYEIVAVVDDRGTATPPVFSNEPASSEGLPVVSAQAALARDDFDVAFVETTNADLMSVAALLADKGVPMHCDKPCGEAMEPYRTILGKCRDRNLPFQIGYMYRGNPALKWIWSFVREGGLGEVRFIEADMNHDYQLEGYEPYVRSFRGGILYNLGCHLIDMVYPLVSEGLSEVRPTIDGTNCKSYLRFGGTDVLIRTSAYMPGGIVCRRLRIDGTKGTIDLCPIERFDGKELKLLLTDADGQREMGFGVQTDRYRDQLADLAAIVRGEKPNDQDYARDLHVHELTLRACGLNAS